MNCISKREPPPQALYAPAGGLFRDHGRFSQFACCAVLNALLFAGVLSVMTPGFESGDDPAMMRIASGTMTGVPSDRLVFSNVLIGSVLRQLYLLAPAVNWYANYLLLTHYLATTALLWTFARLRRFLESACAYLLLFVIFEVRLLVEFQFTSTALLAGFAGALLLFSEMCDTASREKLPIVCGGALMLLSAMIRADAFYFAMLIVVPLVAIALWERVSPFSVLNDYFRRAWPLAVSLIVALGGIAYDHWSYARDPDWRTFRDYQKIRAALYDFSVLQDVPYSRFFFDRVGWSHNDFNMFQHYYLADETLSNAKTLSSLSARFGHVGRNPVDAREHRRTYLDRLAPYFVLTLLNVVLAVVLGGGARLRCVLYAAFGCGLLFAVFFYFSIYAKLATRVTIPAVFALNAALLAVGFGMARAARCPPAREPLPRRNISRRAWFLRVMTSLPFAAVYGLTVYQTTSLHDDMNRLNDGQQRAFEHLIDKIKADTTAGDQPPLFVTWRSEYPQNWAAPSSSGAAALAKFPTIGLGWNTHSPYYRMELANHGIDDIYRALYERPEVHAFSSNFDVENMLNYVLEHHFQAIDSSPPRYYLYDYEPDVLPLYLRTRQFSLPTESRTRSSARHTPVKSAPVESFLR